MTALLLAEPEATMRGFLERQLRSDGFDVLAFPSADALASTFKTSIHQDGINLTNCGDSQSPASWSQQGTGAGQVACTTVQQQGGVAQIMWTTDAKNVMGFIRAANGDVPSLYKWWLTNG